MTADPRAQPTPAGPAESPALVRAIGRWDLTALVVNGVIGSSIFGMPAVLAALTGAWSPVTSILGGLGILTILLCHAEWPAAHAPGGSYLYAREASSRGGLSYGLVALRVR